MIKEIINLAQQRIFKNYLWLYSNLNFIIANKLIDIDYHICSLIHYMNLHC